MVAESEAQSGQHSIKKVFKNWLQEWEAILDETIGVVEATIIPKDKWTDFEAGIEVISSYADTDTLEYYSGLRTLRMLSSMVSLSLMKLRDVNPKPVSHNNTKIDGVIDILNEEEFIEQGGSNPVTEVEDQYAYYTVNYGDTLMGIAKKFGDYILWTDIGEANSVTDSDLIDTDYVGKTLKIPIPQGAIVQQHKKNIVFEPVFKGTEQRDIDRFFYGRDLRLSDDGDLVVDGLDDLSTIEGVRCVTDNIKDRFTSRKGNLNPKHPEWGLEPLDNPAGIPFAIFLEKLCLDMEAQAMDDPRVINASVQRSKMTVIGDALRVPMEINLIGGRTGKITVDDPHKAVT